MIDFRNNGQTDPICKINLAFKNYQDLLEMFESNKIR